MSRFFSGLLILLIAISLSSATTDSILRSHVSNIITTDSSRNYRHTDALSSVCAYITSELDREKITWRFQPFYVNNTEYRNVVAVIGNGTLKKAVIGAHYDVCGDQDGADDNASGVAGLLEIARFLKQNESALKRQYEIVFYTLEEPPFFGTPNMGSYVHAKSLADKKEKIELMVCLEMIGFFTDDPGSQEYPLGIMKTVYPDKGNFIAAVGDFRSRKYVNSLRKWLNTRSTIPCEKLVFSKLLEAIGFSDHRNYWHFKYKAIMLTDTAFYRNRNYHTKHDTIETLDFKKMADLVNSLNSYFLAF